MGPSSKADAAVGVGQSPERTDSRRGPWLPLAIAYGIIQVALWTSGGTQKMVSLAAAVWVIGVTLARHRPARQLGIGFTGLTRALWVIPLGGVGVALILLAGWLGGTIHGLHGPKAPGLQVEGYFIWTVVQQFILQSFFYVNLEELLGAQRALWVSVALFTLAHIPNPVLLVGTLLGGIFFVEMFQRYRNIYPIALVHGMLGMALGVSVPDFLMRHMRVGIGFLRYHGQG